MLYYFSNFISFIITILSIVSGIYLKLSAIKKNKNQVK